MSADGVFFGLLIGLEIGWTAGLAFALFAMWSHKRFIIKSRKGR